MRKKSHTIYLDHAAATPIDARVFQEMKPFLTDQYANPSALYAEAVFARHAIDMARTQVASFLQAPPDTIFFSRGGTHSINMALLGAARAHATHGKHIISTAVEHQAVLATLKQLETEGFSVTYLPVDAHGRVSVDDVAQALQKDTILVSIMYANNEIGTVEPIIDIGKMLLRYKKKQASRYPLFHTDACQAVGSLDMSVERLHVDLLSFNGSKIGGPKGVGALYKRRGIDIDPIMYGGGQEQGVSPGTEDVASIVGLSAAVMKISECKMQNKKIIELRDYLWTNIQKSIDTVVLNGPELHDERLGNNLNVSFLGAESEAIILYLDAEGICVSSGSACTTDSDELSHVLKACGYDDARMKSSIRFSLGTSTTKKDIDRVLKVLPGVIDTARRMNP